ncbi:MAG: DNA polymerase I [Candidatus Parcubacteria bacterium]|nr:DNA polymerase I [Candidatus Parcubacteria bacterium]
MPKTKSKFILIDGNALVHRAFHALPPLTTKDGELVNAVYGFLTIFFKALKEIKPEYVAVTFDLAKKTFRNEMYAEYKATRVKAPQELYDQIPKIKELLQLLNIPIYELEGFEADDVIGTICHLKTVDRPDIETIIVTGDLDTLQLVDDNTKVYSLKRGLSDVIIYDAKNVASRFDGLKPDQMIDYKSLKGDPSDNIPGVKGIGEKTAINLLKQFKSLDNLYKNIDSNKISESVREKLIEHKDEAFMSYKLATIVKDAPVNFNLNDALVKTYNKQTVIELLQKYQFASLASKLPNLGNEAGLREEETAAETQKTDKQDYQIIKTDQELDSFAKLLNKQKIFAFDTETTGLDPFDLQILGLSICWQAGKAFYIPIAEIKGEGLFENIKVNTAWLEKLKPALENPKIKKLGHNVKYDAEVLLNYNIIVTPLVFDPMIADYVLNPGSRGHSLDNLSFVEFGYQKISFSQLTAGEGKKKISITQVPVAKLGNYSCEDADFTWRLYQKFEKKIKSEKLEFILDKIEMPLVPVLIEMEKNGVKIDVKFLKAFSKKLDTQIETISKKIYNLAGQEFNISSPLQLKEILFDKLQISTQGIGRTKTGFSTAADELDKLKGRHEIIDLISEYRELTKLLSTYIDALPELINKKTGRIHTSFNQTITATGRLSSSNPNLQNIPIKTKLGREVRKAIITDPGFKIVSADYSQIELRIVASIANDQNMIKAFENNEDIHTITAANINNVKPEEVTKDMRRAAKEVNFGLMYGMGANGLAARTGITRDQAQQFIAKYFQAFPNIKKYIQETKDFAKENGYVETLFGRRRYLPDIHSGVPNIAAGAERMAINMPIQGTAADLIKLAMINIYEKLSKISLKSKLIMQVHDELVFEVPTAEVSAVSSFIKKEMENVHQFKCPIKVEVESNDNWGKD